MSEHDERDDYDDEPWRPRATPEQMLRNPAAILGAFGIIQLAISILVCFGIVILIIWSAFDPDDPADPDRVNDTIFTVLGCLGSALLVATNAIILCGAGRMRKCRNYRLAVAAALLSLLSLPLYYCIPFAMPVAIWALVVLARRDVRARFEAVAQERASTETPKAC